MVVSIIIPCKNEGKNIIMTLDSLFKSINKVDYEVIVIDDGSNDNCCNGIEKKYQTIKLYRTEGMGAARARDYGAEKAKGNVLIFCDAHLTFNNHWMDKLVSFLGQYDAVSPGIGVMENPIAAGYGLTWDKSLKAKWYTEKPRTGKKVPFLPGGCLCIKRTVFEDIEGFDKGFIVWGHEDEEISLKLWLFGYSCCIYPEVLVFHKFRTQHPYKVTFEHVHYNFLRMVYSHFNEQRINKVKAMLQDSYGYNEAVIKLNTSNIAVQRTRYFKKRKYDDDWFFSRFEIPF
ncbi:glycosyltransferase [Desulfitibacter alkalitolerans]|uniref:glycosyltransferase n=1 Tax=Desulfitibacter alkalitolerans TaxID=264641 RepID=UPI000482C7E6|nr:glycosyltransferase [Desulfitibacter alkalitolerans]